MGLCLYIIGTSTLPNHFCFFQEFSWDEHAFTTVNRFYSEDMGQLLVIYFSIFGNYFLSFGKIQKKLHQFQSFLKNVFSRLFGVKSNFRE